MRLAAFDLGTHTGVAYGDISARPKLHLFELPRGADGLGIMFLEAEQRFGRFLITHKIDTVVAEAPILNNTLHVFRVLLGLTATLQKVCAELKIAYNEVSNGAAKAALSRHGHADKTDQVFASKLFGYEVKRHDEADSLGVFLAFLKESHRPFHARWAAMQNTVAWQELINRIVARGKAKRTLQKSTTHVEKVPARGKKKPKTDVTPRLL